MAKYDIRIVKVQIADAENDNATTVDLSLVDDGGREYYVITNGSASITLYAGERYALLDAFNMLAKPKEE